MPRRISKTSTVSCYVSLWPKISKVSTTIKPQIDILLSFLPMFHLITPIIDVLFLLLKTVMFQALCHHPSKKTIYKRTFLKTTPKIGWTHLLSIICHLAQFLFLQKTDQKTKFCCQKIRSSVFRVCGHANQLLPNEESASNCTVLLLSIIVFLCICIF